MDDMPDPKIHTSLLITRSVWARLRDLAEQLPVDGTRRSLARVVSELVEREYAAHGRGGALAVAEEYARRLSVADLRRLRAVLDRLEAVRPHDLPAAVAEEDRRLAEREGR